MIQVLFSKARRVALPVIVGVLTHGSAGADFVATTIDFNTQTPSGLQRFDEVTGVRLTAGETAPGSVGGFAPFGPTDIAMGPDGYIYASDGFTGSILRFDATTNAPIDPPNQFLAPGLFAQRQTQAQGLSFASLTFGTNGNLYVVDAYDVTETATPSAGIRVYDSTGVQVDTLLESASTTFGRLAGSAVLPGGDLLVSDVEGAVIYRVDVVNDQLSLFASTGLVGPAGIAVAGSGEVFVADLFGNSIVRFDSDGSNPQTFATLPAPTTNFSRFPSDLVFDADGNLIVAVLGQTDPGPDGTADGMILKYDSSGALVDTIAENLRPISSLVIADDLLPGDFDGSGVVDADDYAKWRDDFGATPSPTSGADANGDGTVDAADYTVWRDTLGDSGFLPVPASQPAAAPEPAAWSLALLGILLRGRASRKRHS